ncbi:unnamed protein product [Nyctereutes procyonoides]|uniref:Cytochrome b-c1 complex subunit 8 n=1 Tax=Nyctereutes procyonoides TaxID=34880 RepID=A0A811ZYR5_NYCPR|nr:unnamed protein product [Nyctereutes procyonoides]
MGREFGKLTRMRQVIPYSLSPWSSAPSRRTSAKAPPIAFYLVYTWGTQEFEKSKRKNPAAYESDK